MTTTHATEFDEGQPTIVITFGDDVGTFRSHRLANQFLLVRHLDNIITTGGYLAMEGATVLALDMVLPPDREALEQFLYQHGRRDDYVAAIYQGLSDCWKGETQLPFEQSSESSETTSTPETGSPSTDASPSQDTEASPTLTGLDES